MDARPSFPRVVKSNWRWIGVGVFLGVAALIILIILGIFTRQAYAVPSPATPILVLISAPTASATLPPPPVATVEPIYTATATFPPQVDGSLSPGNLVEVFGTEGDGLRLRDAAGLDSNIVFLAVESEVFELSEGPVKLDGYEWWFLVNPYNIDQTGWAVGTYLRVLD